MKNYLALGDSMSIDYYTGQSGGGAVKRFYKSLGNDWNLTDKTRDGATINSVPRNLEGDLITLTISGNDALLLGDYANKYRIDKIIEEHRDLLQDIRNKNPNSCFIIGNVYHPNIHLSKLYLSLLNDLNEGIEKNVKSVNGRLANIYRGFKGKENKLLILEIEPNYNGAGVICGLFQEQYLDK